MVNNNQTDFFLLIFIIYMFRLGILRQAVDHRAGHLGVQRSVLQYPHRVFVFQDHHVGAHPRQGRRWR